jgi:hypothetical protein
MITAPSANYLMKIAQIVIHQDPKVCAHLCLQIDLDAGHHTIRQQYINNAGKATGAGLEYTKCNRGHLSESSAVLATLHVKQ